MANLSTYAGNFLVDGLFRGGALSSGGAVNSTAVVTGIRAANTAYTVGQVVVPASVDTSAGGKFLQCTTAGTSASTLATLALGNPGSTVTDGTVTWTVVSGMPSPLSLYCALYTIDSGLRANSTAYTVGNVISLTASDTLQHLYQCTTAGTSAATQPTTYTGADGEVITDGTAVFTELSPVLKTGTGFPSGFAEVTGAGYARVKVNTSSYPSLTDWAGTQGAASTTASTGTSQTTSNNNVITFGTPTANWNQIGAMMLWDQTTGGNLWQTGVLTAPKTVNNGDPAPSYAAGALTIHMDN
jgi:hypothetical protein